MKHSKYVNDYWVQKYESGIYHLLFNTSERWLNYHFCGGCDEEMEFEIYRNELEVGVTEYVKNFLPTEEQYIKLKYQEKDQISFYFVPFDMIMHGEILLHTRK